MEEIKEGREKGRKGEKKAKRRERGREGGREGGRGLVHSNVTCTSKANIRYTTHEQTRV